MISVWIGTWNVNGKSPSTSIKPWLLNSNEPDILVFGFQEIDLSTQAHLLYNDGAKKTEWIKCITECIGTTEYTQVSSKQLVGILIVLFVKVSLFEHVSEVSSNQVATGVMGMLGNKGGI